MLLVNKTHPLLASSGSVKVRCVCVRYWAALSSELAAYLTKNLSQRLSVLACCWKRASISQRQSGRGKKLWFLAQVITATILPMRLGGAEKSVRENSTLADLNRRAPVCRALPNTQSFKGEQKRLVCEVTSVVICQRHLHLPFFEIWLIRSRVILLSFASYNIRNNLKYDLKCDEKKKHFDSWLNYQLVNGLWGALIFG